MAAAAAVSERMTYHVKTWYRTSEPCRRSFVGDEEDDGEPSLVQLQEAIANLWPEMRRETYQIQYRDEDRDGFPVFSPGPTLFPAHRVSHANLGLKGQIRREMDSKRGRYRVFTSGCRWEH